MLQDRFIFWWSAPAFELELVRQVNSNCILKTGSYPVRAMNLYSIIAAFYVGSEIAEQVGKFAWALTRGNP